MFTADDYFNITNARILNENVNHLDERKYEPDETQGGLRADRTQGGGYRTLVRREEYEYNELLKFLYFEGYADSYEEAECILEDMSDEEFEYLLENQTWQNVRTAASTPRTNTTPIRLTGSNTALRPADLSPEDPEKEARRKKRGKLSFEVRENFDIVTEFLFVEGYTDTIESAELMAENISEIWVNQILDEKFVGAMDTTGRGPDHRTRFPKFKGKDDEFDPKFTQQRVKSNTKKIDPYFSGRKERKDEKRKGVGGVGG